TTLFRSPVLSAVGVTVARGLRKDRVRRAALLGLLGKGVMRRELTAGVQRERLFERDTGALAHTADLVDDAGEVLLDRVDPTWRVALDLAPLEAGDLLEGLAVVGDRIADLPA